MCEFSTLGNESICCKIVFYSRKSNWIYSSNSIIFNFCSRNRLQIWKFKWHVISKFGCETIINELKWVECTRFETQFCIHFYCKISWMVIFGQVWFDWNWFYLKYEECFAFLVTLVSTVNRRDQFCSWLLIWTQRDIGIIIIRSCLGTWSYRYTRMSFLSSKMPLAFWG